MIAVPRWLLLVLGALFSAYHVILGIYSLDVPRSPVPTIVALALYTIATVLSLWPAEHMRMPDWLAAFDLAVSIVLPLLVTSQLDADADNGYATWYVAAVGTLMTIAAARRQLAAAWLGVIALAVQSVVWAGPLSLGALGVIGSIVWVAIAHMLTTALTTAARETRRYAQAEREAAAWQAAQDAHLFEGRMRLAQTNRIAAPMLRRIADRGGDLTDGQRRECRMLEAAIRDEIRGRMLLTDAVRVEVQRARERGSIVTLLDEGGIDDLDEPARDRVAVAPRGGGRAIQRRPDHREDGGRGLTGCGDGGRPARTRPRRAVGEHRRPRSRVLARDPADLKVEYRPDMKVGGRSRIDPPSSPSHGDNPNIALTRPQRSPVTRPATVATPRGACDPILAHPATGVKSAFRGTCGIRGHPDVRRPRRPTQCGPSGRVSNTGSPWNGGHFGFSDPNGPRRPARRRTAFAETVRSAPRRCGRARRRMPPRNARRARPAAPR